MEGPRDGACIYAQYRTTQGWAFCAGVSSEDDERPMCERCRRSAITHIVDAEGHPFDLCEKHMPEPLPLRILAYLAQQGKL